MILCTARNLHHIILLQRHVQNYFMRWLLRAMHAFETQIHMISRHVMFMRVFQKNWRTCETGLLKGTIPYLENSSDPLPRVFFNDLRVEEVLTSVPILFRQELVI